MKVVTLTLSVFANSDSEAIEEFEKIVQSGNYDHDSFDVEEDLDIDEGG